VNKAIIAATVAVAVILVFGLQLTSPANEQPIQQPTTTTQQPTQTPGECSVSGLRAAAIANNDTVIVEFNSTCSTTAEVYLDSNLLGSVQVRAGFNKIVLTAPSDLQGGQEFVVKVVIAGREYSYPVKVEFLQESLKIVPDSYVDATNGTLVLIVQNIGDWPAKIVKIEVNGAEAPAEAVNPPYPIVLNPKETTTILVDLEAIGIEVKAGVQYSVAVYTEFGNVYTTIVYGK